MSEIFKLEIQEIKFDFNKPATELSSQLVQAMYDNTMQTFKEEGPGWTPLKPRTKKQRLRQGFGEGPILDRRRAVGLGLRGSIIMLSNAEQAVVGVRRGIPYSRIHQLGGVITRHPYSSSVRLRTTKSGKLVRQKNYKNLAVFGKKSHKLVRSVRYTVAKAFSIKIPARPYLVWSARLKDQVTQIAKSFVSGRR